jgi:hypothetical protein
VLANNGRGFDVFGAERTDTLPCGRSGRARLLDHDLRPRITDGHGQCNNPPDQGPSEEQIYGEYGAGIGLLPRDHCREEVASPDRGVAPGGLRYLLNVAAFMPNLSVSRQIRIRVPRVETAKTVTDPSTRQCEEREQIRHTGFALKLNEAIKCRARSVAQDELTTGVELVTKIVIA